MTGLDVVGFGALNVDKLYRVNMLATADAEGYAKDFETSCGGSAANTIVGLARLGCGTGFIGKLANDREGTMLLEGFRREGVDTHGIRIAKNGRSGTVMGFIDEKGERALYVDSGINDTISPSDVNVDYAKKAKFLHLTSFVGERSFGTQKELLKAVPESVRISLDPGEIYARKGLAALEPILSRTFVLMPNARELQILTGKPDYKENAETMLHKGVKIVALKLGRNGCYITDGRESHRVEAFKVKVVDTTGAGDAFCAGFLYGLLSGRSLNDCGKIGNFVASRCVMRMGARTGLPTLVDLRKSELAQATSRAQGS